MNMWEDIEIDIYALAEHIKSEGVMVTLGMSVLFILIYAFYFLCACVMGVWLLLGWIFIQPFAEPTCPGGKHQEHEWPKAGPNVRCLCGKKILPPNWNGNMGAIDYVPAGMKPCTPEDPTQQPCFMMGGCDTPVFCAQLHGCPNEPPAGIKEA